MWCIEQLLMPLYDGVKDVTLPVGTIDVLLVARGGVARMLRIDKAGGWVAGEETVSAA